MTGFLIDAEKKISQNYGKIQNKFKFLPQSPLKTLGYPGVKIIDLRLKGIMESFNDPDVREILKFNLENLERLQSHKDGTVLGHYLEFIKKTENIEGDILELGTYKGVSTILFSKFLDLINSKKKIYSCDAFIGLPYDDKFSASKNAKGEFADTSLEFVKLQFEKFGVKSRIEIINGLFENTLYQKLSNNKFSFVLVDCDIYDSTKFCLPFIYERTNGVIAFDDYGADKSKEATWGETKAVDEFCSEKKIKLQIKPIPHMSK